MGYCDVCKQHVNYYKKYSFCDTHRPDIGQLRKQQRDTPSMPYHPLNDCVLIEPEEDPTYAQMTGTKLHIPEAFKYGPVDAPKWGRILAFGPRCKMDAPIPGWINGELKVGDRVLYAKFGWSKVPLEDGKHLALVRELDLIAVDR